MSESLGGKVFTTVLKRVLKPVPIIGTVVVLVTAASVLRRKGILRGGVDIALDAIPVVGTAKGLAELVTGDLIPEAPARAARRKRVAERTSKAA